ncbi:GntR family transcriptional regulator [Nocardioides sp.]|uniref:GntR family transcriptional regulator n=1 Tax=Nocardioides sp. TaxID=35761 RepID=UPI001A278F57|nr:GntR family transcriptional regulator [Nocardioides sp.]MBJ7356438.1 GntR family transcriptional regulator [Nocardioides sp.]
MTEWRDPERHVRTGMPPFVDAYNRVRELIRRDGLEPGEQLPNEVVIGGELSIRRELAHEALLLLEEDGHLVRDRDRRWCVAPAPPYPVGFADGFHRQLRDAATPVRRLHAAVERGGSWSRELLRTDEPKLVWETVFELDGVLLASTLEVMPLSVVPPEVAEADDEAQRDVGRWPTLLDALDPARRAAMVPMVWRLSPVSRDTERLSWMELPLHGMPAVVTSVLAQDGAPAYLAKNIFDLTSFQVAVDLLGPPQPR